MKHLGKACCHGLKWWTERILQIQYVKVPYFFWGARGFLGHTHLECGSVDHEVDKVKWRDWFKLDWKMLREKVFISFIYPSIVVHPITY
jgi:hypothetical protein